MITGRLRRRRVALQRAQHVPALDAGEHEVERDGDRLDRRARAAALRRALRARIGTYAADLQVRARASNTRASSSSTTSTRSPGGITVPSALMIGLGIVVPREVDRQREGERAAFADLAVDA